MQLLIDSDIFCKLGIAGLLKPMLALLDVQAKDCGRLPALVPMLKRGRLPTRYGVSACLALVPLAEEMPIARNASAEWLEPLTGIPDVDPGEVQLLASAAQYSFMLATGDKRALKAVRNTTKIASAIDGRIICLEEALIMLCRTQGAPAVAESLNPILACGDKTVTACFAGGGKLDPREGLQSYRDSLESDIHPLRLWRQT